MTNSNRYFTARVVCDSLGHEVIPSNAISVGTLDPVAECEARNRALDAREHKLTEYEHDLIDLDSALNEARADAIAAQKDYTTRTLLADFISKLDALAARMDSFEQEQRSRNAEPIVLPPGTDADPDNPAAAVGDDDVVGSNEPIADEGELQASKPPLQRLPEHDEPELEPPPELMKGDDGDGDPGAVLPRTPILPSDVHYDPRPTPVSELNLPTVED
jgi:hypothetical protein